MTDRKIERVKYMVWKAYPNVFDYAIKEMKWAKDELRATITFRTSPVGEQKTAKIFINDEGGSFSEGMTKEDPRFTARKKFEEKINGK